MDQSFEIHWSAAGRGGRIWGVGETLGAGGWRAGLRRCQRRILEDLVRADLSVGTSVFSLDLEFRYHGPAEGAVGLPWLPEEHVSKRWPRSQLVVVKLTEHLIRVAFDLGEPEDGGYWDGYSDDNDWYF